MFGQSDGIMSKWIFVHCEKKEMTGLCFQNPHIHYSIFIYHKYIHSDKYIKQGKCWAWRDGSAMKDTGYFSRGS